jgi:hypothetical protein
MRRLPLLCRGTSSTGRVAKPPGVNLAHILEVRASSAISLAENGCRKVSRLSTQQHHPIARKAIHREVCATYNVRVP